MAAFTAESPASDTPPWLATAPEPPALPASEPTAAEVTMAGAAATPASELPDWLQGLGPAEAALGAEPPADSADLPDWLKAATGTAASDETPPWLSEAPTPPTSEAPSMAEAAALDEVDTPEVGTGDPRLSLRMVAEPRERRGSEHPGHERSAGHDDEQSPHGTLLGGNPRSQTGSRCGSLSSL